MARPRQQRLDPARTLADRAARAGSAVSASAQPTSAQAKSARSTQPRRATAGEWIEGARLRTLPLAVAPVAVGTAAGYLANSADVFHPGRAALALVVALALQIGVNFSNDYSDGVRGTDDNRIGPARLTGSGAAAPRTVLIVALAFFALSAVAGLALVVLTGAWWLLIVGAVAIVAAWYYTGGRHPYGYAGLGELFVFVFFGLVATLGSTFVQSLSVNLESWLGGIAIGLLACAVLMSNNLRDIDQDRLSRKRTLAVLLGSTGARVTYVAFMLIPFALLVLFAMLYPKAWLVFFVLLAALPACVIAATAHTSKEFLLALQLSSITALVYGLGLGAAIAF